LSSGYAYWKTHAFLPEGLTGRALPSSIGPTHDWSLGMKAGYVIFDSGRRAAHLRRALAQRGVAQEEADRIRRDIAFEVHVKFYPVLSALEARKVAEANLRTGRESLRVAELKESAGEATHADVARAQVEVANARLELVRIEKTVRIAQGGLNTVLCLPAEQRLLPSAEAHEISPRPTVLFLSFLSGPFNAGPRSRRLCTASGLLKARFRLQRAPSAPRSSSTASTVIGIRISCPRIKTGPLESQ